MNRHLLKRRNVETSKRRNDVVPVSTFSAYPLSTWCVWVLAIPLLLVLTGVVIVTLTSAGSIPFDHPDLWWLLGLVPLAGLLMLYGRLRKRAALYRFTSVAVPPSPGLAPLLAPRVSSSKQAARAGLVVVAIVMAVTAVIGPRWGMYLEKHKVRGIDIVVALDVSRSMLAGDIEPNRLESAKRQIRQQLTERAVFGGSNRLALIAFAGSTSLKVPLTTDHQSFRSKLQSLDVGSAPRGGTALAEAIRAAADLLVKSPEEATKIIMLFTDGEDHEGGPVSAAAEVLAQRNVMVYCVGVGDPARTVGAEIPTDAAVDTKPLVYDGQIVFSKLDVAGLRRIAESGGGRYAPIQDLYALVNGMARLRRTELTTEERRRHKPRYQWFLAVALLCLGLETLVREQRASETGLPRRVWQQETL